jgi:hypothetical protein
MTGSEIATLTISLVSLSISIFAAYKTYGLGEYQLRLANRNEFQKLLIDVNKVLVERPELWAIYDSHPIPREGLRDPKERARLEALAYMLLNVFECVFTFYGDSPRLTKAERESFAAWKGFLNNLLQDSSLMRELLDKPNLRLMYNAKLIAEVDSILKGNSLATSKTGEVQAKPKQEA